MTSRPTIDPVWATDTNYTNGPEVGTPTKVNPGAAVRTEGALPDTIFPAQHFNHQMGLLAQWLAYYKDLDWLNLQPIPMQAFSDSILNDGPIGSIGHRPVDTDPGNDVSFLAACVASTEILQSKDGIYWTVDGSAGTFTGVEHPRALFWSAIASLWILVTNAGATHKIRTAPHAPGGAFVWTTRTDPQAGNPSHGGVVEAEGIIVCASANIITSADGITWTDRGNVTGGSFRDVAYSATLSGFCAVGNTGAIATSPDGITWTDRTTGTANFKSVVRDEINGYWIACAGGALIYRSASGITWTDVGLGGTLSDDFVSLATDGAGTVYMTSIGLVLRTTNGGSSWDIQRSPSHIGDPNFCAVFEGRLMIAGGNAGGTTEPGLAMGMQTSPLFASITP